MKETVITVLLLASLGAAHGAPPDASVVEDRERAPLSIAIDGPNGTSFRLVYTAGNGWKFADQPDAKLASALSQQQPSRPIQVPLVDTPQSVVIDGPSGYVFVYVIDEDWRFVGSVAGEKR